jgi:hypothetical protein
MEMDRRAFVSLAGAAVIAASLSASEEQLALARAKEIWGSCALVEVKRGVQCGNSRYDRHGVGWKDSRGCMQWFYGDSWDEAFSTHQLLKDQLDPATGLPMMPNPPGRDS